MTLPIRRHYVGEAPTQQLASNCLTAATSLTIGGSFTGWPATTPFFGTLEWKTANEEHVLVTNVTGTTATITRGQSGSTAVDHFTGATFDHLFILQDADEANAHTSASAGVHGLSSSASVLGSINGATNTPTTAANNKIQSGTFSSVFTNVNSTSSTLTYPVAFTTAPVVIGTVIVGSNDDILLNWTANPTATQVAWRLFQKSGTVIVSATVVVHWIAIGT